MQLELSKKEFRRLLDMVYIGNWILNSTRGDDRFADYDQVESKLFALCRENGMASLVERWNGEDVPSRAFSDGGIHEAIADYEDTVFYEILAEELARRDMDYQPVSNENYDALVSRMDDYLHSHDGRLKNGRRKTSAISFLRVLPTFRLVLLFIEHHHKPGDSGNRANQCNALQSLFVCHVLASRFVFCLFYHKAPDAATSCRARFVFTWYTASKSRRK